jgi:hypothetical protein
MSVGEILQQCSFSVAGAREEEQQRAYATHNATALHRHSAIKHQPQTLEVLSTPQSTCTPARGHSWSLRCCCSAVELFDALSVVPVDRYAFDKREKPCVC